MHEPNWLVLKRLPVAGFEAPSDTTSQFTVVSAGRCALVYDKTTRSVELPSYNVSFSREEGVQIEYVVASRVWGGERNVRNCALYLIACRDGKQERWSIVKPLFAGRSRPRLSSHSAYMRDRSTRGRDQTVSGCRAEFGKRKSHIQVRLPRMDRNSSDRAFVGHCFGPCGPQAELPPTLWAGWRQQVRPARLAIY